MLYVLNSAKDAVAAIANYTNDQHVKDLSVGGSTYTFDIAKDEDSVEFLQTGNYLIMQDNMSRNWVFYILRVTATQENINVYATDAGITLINRMMGPEIETSAHPVDYYVNQILQGTPWEIGVNEISSLTRTLNFTDRDTGLKRLLEILNEFDNAEVEFQVQLTGLHVDKWLINIRKQLGTVRDDVQIDYDDTLNDITKTEDRSAFVTALQGQAQPDTTDSQGSGANSQASSAASQASQASSADNTANQVITFTDLAYDDGDFFTTKGDPYLYARTNNNNYNNGNPYIQSFYDSQASTPQSLLQETLAQLKQYSVPALSFECDITVVDPTLQLGDTVTIIDHDYRPALYLRARVMQLTRSYTNPSQDKIVLGNYQILQSNISDSLKALQNQIRQLQNSTNSLGGAVSSNASNISSNASSISSLNSQVSQVSQAADSAITAANGKNTLGCGKQLPATAKDGDIYYLDLGNGETAMYIFKDGHWQLVISTADTDAVKKQVEAAQAGIKTAETDAQNAVKDSQKNTSKITQMQKDINLRVKTGDVISQINIEAGNTLIQSNKIYLDASSVVFSGKAFIPSAAIVSLSADQITTGTLNGANVNVINLNGKSIAANSITADKIQAGELLIGLNQGLQGMRITNNGIVMTDGGQTSMFMDNTGLHVWDSTNGEDVGWIHTNHLKANNYINGLEFDLNDKGDYMGFAVYDDSSKDYALKFGWSRQGDGFNGSTGVVVTDHFSMNDEVWFNNGTVHLAGADKVVSFSSMKINNSNPSPYIGTDNSGIVFGDSGELYFYRYGRIYALIDILNKEGFFG